MKLGEQAKRRSRPPKSGGRMKSLKALDRTVSSNKQRWINGERDGFRLKGRKVSRRTFSRHVKVPDAWKTAARSKGHVNGGKKKTP